MMKILLAAVAVLLGLSLYMDFSVTFWGDQDWELLVARMWLDGKKLYVDHVPVTGPLLFYLYALPVWLSRHLSFLQDYQALVLLTLLAIAAVIVLCTRLMILHPGFKDDAKKWQWIMVLLFLLIIRIRPLFFGDREHILIILTLPYLLRFMPSLNNAALSTRLRISIGALAAIGFFIKPHCLLLFAAINAIHILYTRSLRILHSSENITIYVLGVLYGFIVWLYTPEYLTLILPFAYATYSANRNTPVGLLTLILSVTFTFIMLRPRVQSLYRKDIYYFTAMLPFLLLYIVANNGWNYTYQPFLTVLLLTNAFVLWEFLSRGAAWERTRWKPMLGVIFCLINFGFEIYYAGWYLHGIETHPCHGDKNCPGYYEPFVNDIKNLHAHSFGSIGMDFATWTRVSKLSGAAWETRFPQFWMLSKFFGASKEFYNAHRGILLYVANALAEDLDQKKPDLVFVELPDSIYNIRLNKDTSWLKILGAVPAFETAWRHYSFVHTIDNCMLLPAPLAIVTGNPTKRTDSSKTEGNCNYEMYQRITTPK